MNERSFFPPDRVLMGPGPSDVQERVLQAMARPTIGHLDPQFIQLMDGIKNLLRYALRTNNSLTMPVSGPGTAGMECCVVNLVEPGDKVVVCQNGVFGGRLKQMVERCGGLVVDVEDPWGRAVSPEKLESALGRHPDTKLVAFVHAETSTGALSDAETLAGIASKYGCLVLVDAVTSLGGVALEPDLWGIDAIYSGSQKCLSCPPGLSPISLNQPAAEKVRGRKHPVQSWFMDLNLVMEYWDTKEKRSYHHTAPVNALYGLQEALLALQEEGIETAWDRHRTNHLALRAGLDSLGLEFIVPEAERIPQLNAVGVPKGVDEGRVRRRLLDEHRLEIGAGLGTLAGKVWRIGLMGYSSRRENVLHCISSLGAVLRDEGVSVDVQAAITAADSVF